jgi:polyphosphate kinase
MMYQFELNQHLFSKLSPFFVFSISVVKLINQSFDLCDRLAIKMNIYHKLKVSYIIRHVIIKHALVKELLILQVQKWWYKTLIKMHF